MKESHAEPKRDSSTIAGSSPDAKVLRQGPSGDDLAEQLAEGQPSQLPVVPAFPLNSNPGVGIDSGKNVPMDAAGLQALVEQQRVQLETLNNTLMAFMQLQAQQTAAVVQASTAQVSHMAAAIQHPQTQNDNNGEPVARNGEHKGYNWCQHVW